MFENESGSGMGPKKKTNKFDNNLVLNRFFVILELLEIKPLSFVL